MGVYRTTDGGATWTLADFGTPGYIGPTAFRESMTGWVVVQDCNVAFTCSTGLPATHILRTDDGGVTWSQAGSLDLPSPLQTPAALVLHSTTLYLTGSGLASRSLDEGTTWQAMEHPAISFDSNVDFVDKSVGYVMSRADLLRTDDAGRNWQRSGLIPDGAQFLVRFINANTGFTAGRTCEAPGVCAAKLWRTRDGGETWDQVLSVNDENAHVLDVRFVDGQHGFVAFNTGVAVTNDGGATWEQHPAPAGWSVPEFAVADAANLWAVLETIDYPNSYELSHSTDEGRTWQTVLTLPGYTPSLIFIDRDHGWYADSTCMDQCVAKLHATSDGGATWREQDPGVGSVNDIVFVDPLNGWINGSSCPSLNCGGTVLHTADGGDTWTAQLVGGPFIGTLEFADAENGWLALSEFRGTGIGGGPANRTVLYHTTDAGGGPIGRRPELPDTGAGVSDSGGLIPALLLAAAGAIALATAGALQRRRR